MDQKTETRSVIVQKYISDEIDRALSRHRLPCTSPIREDLSARAELVGVRAPEVRVPDESNRTLTLDDRLAQLRHDARFSGCFPPDPPRISRTDQAKLNANFEKILTGEIIVE